MNMEPMFAAGKRFWRLPHRLTEMMYKFLAPVLSAQFITAPTGQAYVILYLVPEAAPPPVVIYETNKKIQLSVYTELDEGTVSFFLRCCCLEGKEVKREKDRGVKK